MKHQKKKRKKWLGDFTIEVKRRFDLKTILRIALDKYAVKDLLEYMAFITAYEGYVYGMSMMRLLATEKDAEKVKSMILLKYMLDNWDKENFLKKAGKHFGKAMKKAEKRIEKKNSQKN